MGCAKAWFLPGIFIKIECSFKMTLSFSPFRYVIPQSGFPAGQSLAQIIFLIFISSRHKRSGWLFGSDFAKAIVSLRLSSLISDSATSENDLSLKFGLASFESKREAVRASPHDDDEIAANSDPSLDAEVHELRPRTIRRKFHPPLVLLACWLLHKKLKLM